MNKCILSNTFSVSIEVIIWFFFFHCIKVMYHIDWFVYTEHHPRDKFYLIKFYLIICPSIPGIWSNSIWSWWMTLFRSCRIWFAEILIEILKFSHLHSPEISACSFSGSFLIWLLVSRYCCPHKISLGVFPPLRHFGRVWEVLALILL